MHMQNLNKTYTSEGTKDLERHYILDIFFKEDFNKTYPITTQSWEKIVKLMNYL